MVDFAAHTANIIGRLGRPVSVTPFGQSARVVNAVFVQHPAMAFNLVEGVSPTIRLMTQDAAGLVNGDPVQIDAVNFTVANLHADVVAGDVVIDLEAV